VTCGSTKAWFDSTMTDAVRVLVTNDDGIDAVGLHRLAGAVHARGLEVVVAAPRAEYSGMSAALTAVDDNGRIPVEARTLPGLAEVPAHAVSASPAFIVLLATRGAFGPVPDVVLSGVNHGPNLGAAVLHSGTVGAALTAAAGGCRAMAVSLDVNWGPLGGVQLEAQEPVVEHFDTAVAVAVDLLPWVIEMEPGVVLNVNVPNRPDVLGIRRGGLAEFGAVQMAVRERGEGFVRMTLDASGATLDPGSDEAWVAQGYVSVTPVRPPVEATDVRLPGLVDPVGDHSGG
jgi:5'-nucleotidase